MGMDGDCRAETSGGNGRDRLWDRDRAGSLMGSVCCHNAGTQSAAAGLKGDTEGLQKPKMIHLHKSFHLTLSLFLLSALTKSA